MMGLLYSENFRNIDYLQEGNPRQRRSYDILKQFEIMERLADFSPLLVGTIPIDIDLPDSDLDIICEVHDMEACLRIMKVFSKWPEFRQAIRTVHGTERIVISFDYMGQSIEVFGQPIPTVEQNGYRHMLIEHKILTLLGSPYHEKIRELKRQGLKTEPAFAELLGLQGDPYLRLLEMSHWNDGQLRIFLQGKVI